MKNNKLSIFVFKSGEILAIESSKLAQDFQNKLVPGSYIVETINRQNPQSDTAFLVFEGPFHIQAFDDCFSLSAWLNQYSMRNQTIPNYYKCKIVRTQKELDDTLRYNHHSISFNSQSEPNK